MSELFKTVLILSGFGCGLTALLLVSKPITAKKFPAKWQYWVWIAVMVSMLVPVYKFIPKHEAKKLIYSQNTDIILPEATNDKVYVTIPNGEVQTVVPKNLTPKQRVQIWDLTAYIWFAGMCVYIVTVGVSYGIYLAKKQKFSVEIEDSDLLSSVKSELGIKKKIRLRKCSDIDSPMLVGVIRPAVYIPTRELSDESIRMIFLHELTHYKRRDLCIKWLAVFVNAVHWFNPFAYLLCANVGEACEVSCDMAVTKSLSPEEQKTYMKTILDLAG